jgi:hypothetical protein
MRCEARTLDDIKALGGNDADGRTPVCYGGAGFGHQPRDVPEVCPAVRARRGPSCGPGHDSAHESAPSPIRDVLERKSVHGVVETAAQKSREGRRAASHDNPFIKAQEVASKSIVGALDAWRDMVERVSESTFLSLYGSPLLQAAVGIDPASTEPMRKAGKSTLHLHLVEGRIAELKARIPEGNIREATIRALIYVGMARNSLDERGFESIRRIRRELKDSTPLPIADFKALVRDQHSMLLIDQSAALAAIPSMLPPDPRSAARRWS